MDLLLNGGWQLILALITGLIGVNYALFNSIIDKKALEIKEEMRKEFLLQIEKHCAHLEKNILMQVNFLKANNKDSHDNN